MRELLTSEAEIAAFLGLGRAATKRLLETKAFPFVHVGGRTMARAADVLRWKQRPTTLVVNEPDLARWFDDGGGTRPSGRT